LWEQNNKLWEQDIILREQNKSFSRMALISHRTYTMVKYEVIFIVLVSIYNG